MSDDEKKTIEGDGIGVEEGQKEEEEEDHDAVVEAQDTGKTSRSTN
jgi:hypothetical protein